jgi:hypothetical protein
LAADPDSTTSFGSFIFSNSLKSASDKLGALPRKTQSVRDVSEVVVKGSVHSSGDFPVASSKSETRDKNVP